MTGFRLGVLEDLCDRAWDSELLLYPFSDLLCFVLVYELLLLEVISHLAKGFHGIREWVHSQATAIQDGIRGELVSLDELLLTDDQLILDIVCGIYEAFLGILLDEQSHVLELARSVYTLNELLDRSTAAAEHPDGSDEVVSVDVDSDCQTRRSQEDLIAPAQIAYIGEQGLLLFIWCLSIDCEDVLGLDE